jgi:hypothetical protein
LFTIWIFEWVKPCTIYWIDWSFWTEYKDVLNFMCSR